MLILKDAVYGIVGFLIPAYDRGEVLSQLQRQRDLPPWRYTAFAARYSFSMMKRRIRRSADPLFFTAQAYLLYVAFAAGFVALRSLVSILIVLAVLLVRDVYSHAPQSGALRVIVDAFAAASSALVQPPILPSSIV
jgi:hypothetical protein